MFRSPDNDETEVQFDQRMLEMSLGILKPQSPEQRLREQAEIERTMHFVAAFHAAAFPGNSYECLIDDVVARQQ